MKIRKKGNQHNVTLNWYYYETIYNVLPLLKEEKIGFIDYDNHWRVSYDVDRWLHTYEDNHHCFDNHYESRVFLDDVEELKLQYDKIHEVYETVAILHDGTVIHVSL